MLSPMTVLSGAKFVVIKARSIEGLIITAAIIGIAIHVLTPNVSPM
jgi:hypothetical protein